MEFVGSMDDIPENLRGMDFDFRKDRRDNRRSIRDLCQEFRKPYRDNCPRRISWFARCTWIPAVDKATSRKRSNGQGPRKVRKHHIVNFLTSIYLTIIVMAAGAIAVPWIVTMVK